MRPNTVIRVQKVSIISSYGSYWTPPCFFYFQDNPFFTDHQTDSWSFECSLLLHVYISLLSYCSYDQAIPEYTADQFLIPADESHSCDSTSAELPVCRSLLSHTHSLTLSQGWLHCTVKELRIFFTSSLLRTFGRRCCGLGLVNLPGSMTALYIWL